MDSSKHAVEMVVRIFSIRDTAESSVTVSANRSSVSTITNRIPATYGHD
jgi:hypothetical protein